MTFDEAKEQIPLYINIKGVAQLLGVGRNKAAYIFHEVVREHKDVPRIKETEIPVDWILEKYGVKNATKKKKDA